MKRRVLAVLAAGMVLVLRMACSAAGMGSLTLRLAVANQPVPDAAVAVYRVGTAVAGGYRLTEAFGGGFLAEADVLYPELTAWLARSPGGQGLRQRTNEHGEAYFAGLEEGLYLVVQEGRSSGVAFEPFILILPWDGAVWDITAAPKMVSGSEQPETGDPGVIQWGLWGMACSGAALAALLRRRKCT